VLIVGGGPVGLALALDLGRKGVDLVLVEARDGSVNVPKMNMVNARSMEFCRRWGLAGRIKEIGWPDDFENNAMFVTSLGGFELATFDYPSYAQRGELPYTPEGSRRISQMLFDPMLAEETAKIPGVSRLYRTRMEAFEQFPDRVEARLVDRDTGEETIVSADYLVGCDGAESSVREMAGIDINGSMRISSSISMFLHSPGLRAANPKRDAWVYWCFGPEGIWGSMGNIDGHDLWRSSCFTQGPDPDLDNFDPYHWVGKAIGFDHPFEIKAVLPWDRREMVARRYVSGRVILAGDSAHAMSPTGGLGMNTGLGDADGLSWRLAAIVQGWGDPALLDSYDRERRPVAEQNVSEATTSYRRLEAVPRDPAMLDDTPAGAAVRAEIRAAIKAGDFEREFEQEGTVLGYDYYDSPIVMRDGSERIEHDSKIYVQQARPGHRAPHAWIGDGVSTLDLFGAGFALLRFDAAADVSRLAEAAGDAGVPLAVHDIGDPAVAALYERKLVLVRPDGHVAWRADAEPGKPAELWDVVCGRAGAASREAAE
jgi:2-polyprenyl-6-methoxyphenol hydroxylase-like FAD-dependent oxidoreductase